MSERSLIFFDPVKKLKKGKKWGNFFLFDIFNKFF